jgi:selenocysteine-specific elongation factor
MAADRSIGAVTARKDALIVGTAGHIDHGKTTLVKALTGVDCDRLDEEKRRGITIVLGFAPLTLPDGRLAGVVDVPGHERFVRTMVAGAGGVDVGLLVVSAEEGVMPQTREHLEILRLLAVPQLVVALSRADLVQGDLLQLAELDVRELLAGSPWPEAAVVAVSGVTGLGVEELRAQIAAAADRLPARAEGPVFRLPVDRSFSVRGFGTVVTGTARDGRLEASSSLEILPGRLPVRVRGMQVHGAAAEEASAGSRLALNLQGVESAAVPPGSWVATRGALSCGDRLDVEIALLPGAPWALANNARLRLLYGTAELMATVRLLDPGGGPAPEELAPGELGLAQLQLDADCGAVAGDRFVLRSESPVHTLGGGRILDPEPPLLRRREREAAAALLGVLRDRSADSRGVVGALLRRQPGEALDLAALRRRLPPRFGDPLPAAEALVAAGDAVALPGEPRAWASMLGIEHWTGAAAGAVDAHHAAHPLLDGPLISELRQALLPPPGERLFDALLPQLCLRIGLERRGQRIARPSHRAEPAPPARAVLDQLVARLAAGEAHPPPLEDATAGLDLPPDALHWLVDRGELLRVAEDYYVERAAFRTLVRQLVRHMRSSGQLSPQDFKEISGLSRRHAIPFLEFLDRQRITARAADGRTLREAPSWVEDP